ESQTNPPRLPRPTSPQPRPRRTQLRPRLFASPPTRGAKTRAKTNPSFPSNETNHLAHTTLRAHKSRSGNISRPLPSWLRAIRPARAAARPRRPARARPMPRARSLGREERVQDVGDGLVTGGFGNRIGRLNPWKSGGLHQFRTSRRGVESAKRSSELVA